MPRIVWCGKKRKTVCMRKTRSWTSCSTNNLSPATKKPAFCGLFHFRALILRQGQLIFVTLVKNIDAEHIGFRFLVGRNTAMPFYRARSGVIGSGGQGDIPLETLE